MWRKLNRDEFLSSNPLLSQPEAWQVEEQLVWNSYEEYDAYTGQGRPVGDTTVTYDSEEDIGGPPYLEAAEDTRILRQYQPLVDEPDLFIKFARLFDSMEIDQEEASGTNVNFNLNHDWLFKYGLLGLQQVDTDYHRDAKSNFVLLRYSDRGGPEETFNRFMKEAFVANWLARLYEAALSRNVEKLEEALFSHPYITGFGRRDISEYLSEHLSFLKSAQRVVGTKADHLAHLALVNVAGGVGTYLNAFAYPNITFEAPAITGGKLVEPGSLSGSLMPRNLLGAMYIQFYWLISSARQLSRCKTCNGLIAYSPPVPGSGRQRKTYSNKKYCSDSCRQRHYYKNSVKPAREKKRRHQ